MLRIVALFFFAATCLGGTAAHATKVNGKIVVTQKLRESLADAESRDPRTSGYWNEPNGLRQVDPPMVDPSKDLGVIIMKEGATAPAADEVTTVEVKAGSLARNVVVVRPGSRIKFLNVDPFDHSLYSPGMDGFGPEQQSRKAFRPIDFKAEGIHEIRCKLLTHFKGWVVVTPATMVLEVKESGEFTLEEMEPGKYTVKVFLAGRWFHEQSFEVTGKEKEQLIEVKLDAPAGDDGKTGDRKTDDKKADGEKADGKKADDKGEAE